jgi:hypothetical protein
MARSNMYVPILEKIFFNSYKEGNKEVPFKRTDIETIANELGIRLPLNQGDLMYTFRYRRDLPASIAKTAPKGYVWIIRGDGSAKYKFALVTNATFLPSENYMSIKIPDATPGIVSRYALDDEQALLAKIRYNRLIDIFTGVTCYSLQNHLRTTVKNIGQVETDELYVGVDKQGVHYVFPVQAKGGRDKVGIVQIEQDFAICQQKFPNAVGRPIAAQFMNDDTIVLFEFVMAEDGVRISSEKHYRLVNPDELSDEEIKEYRKHTAS